jgi:NAD-dependent deacetylase sirtuin 5
VAILPRKETYVRLSAPVAVVHSCSVGFPSVLSASPNPAHYALALLSIPSFLQAVAPNCTRYTVITQNVDGLSTRAYREVMSRHSQSDNNTVPLYPPDFFEMHGRLLDTLCTSCGHREHNDANSLYRISSSTEATQVLLADLPRCTRCSGLLRPGVVWFEEIPHHLLEINRAVETADLCLVIGTSLTVSRPFALDVCSTSLLGLSRCGICL